MDLSTDSDSDSDSDSDDSHEGEGKRLRRVFEPYLKKTLRYNGLIKQMNQRCTDSSDSTSYILLCAAIQRNDDRSARALLKHYCRGNAGKADPSKDMPLQLAVLAGNVDVARMLLARGARVGVSFHERKQPLHLICDRQSSPLASEASRLAIAKLLIKHGADVNAQESVNGDSPLMLAVRGKSLELAKYLLAAGGADKHCANRHSETALHVAFSEDAGIDMIKLLYGDGDFELCQQQQQLGGRGKKAPRLSMLSQAVRNLMKSGLILAEALEPVLFLLRHGVSVNSSLDGRANRILHAICQNEAAQAARVFLDYGAEVNARNSDGKTALHFCAEKQPPGVLELLLERGAEVGALTNCRQSALHFAAANRSAGALELLLRRGRRELDVDAKAEDGRFTPLFSAVWSGRRDNARLLLDWRASVDERVINNQTVLHVAVDQKHADIVELLLERRADVDLADDYGNTPLSISLCQIIDSVDSDREDDREEDAVRPAEAVRKILVRHAAKLCASGQRLSEHSSRVLNNSHFKPFFDDCTAELCRMKHAKLVDNVTLFDLLTKNNRKLVSYVRNERFMDGFHAANCKQNFLIYGKALECNVCRAIDRLALLDASSLSLNKIVQSLDESWMDTCLPGLVLEHILSYLNIVDLQNLALLSE